MDFRKNMHIAKKINFKKIMKMIKNYPSKFPTPKYMLFIKRMIMDKWEVRLYEARVSKYVFCKRGERVVKIRFSNHRPLLGKELEEDCDFYVGISHRQVSTTESIIKKLAEIKFNDQNIGNTDGHRCHLKTVFLVSPSEQSPKKHL